MQIHRILGTLALSLLFAATGVLSPAQAHDNRPLPPSALVGVEMSESEFALSWAPSVDAPEASPLHYRVYKSENNGPFLLIGEATQTTFIDVEYREGTTSAYAVTSFDTRSGESEMAVLVVQSTSGTCVKMYRTSVAIYMRACMGH